MRAAAIVIALALAGVRSAEAGERKPLITTDLIYGTCELVYDIYDAAYVAVAAGPVEKLSPKVTEILDKGLEVACEKLGKKKGDVYSKIEEIKANVAQFRVAQTANMETVREKLNVKVAGLVDKFDVKFPRYAGVVPKTAGDLIFFSVYACFVMYILFFITKSIIRFLLGVFCFFCCCGCCRRGSSTKPTNGKKSKAAQKGEVAAKAKAVKKKA